MELYLENHSRLESVTTEDLYSNMHLHDEMYDPSQLVSDFPSGRSHNTLEEVQLVAIQHILHSLSSEIKRGIKIV